MPASLLPPFPACAQGATTLEAVADVQSKMNLVVDSHMSVKVALMGVAANGGAGDGAQPMRRPQRTTAYKQYKQQGLQVWRRPGAAGAQGLGHFL